MSIYSGFATRQQEQTYDGLLHDLLDVLQRRLIKFYTGKEADEHKFHLILNNIHTHLARMEDSKYLEPKYSPVFKELLTLTSTVNHSFLQMQKQIDQEAVSNPAVALPKESLSFSRDKISEDLKSWGFGKIRHQIYIKDEFSSKGETNPEQPLLVDMKMKRGMSSQQPRTFRSRRQFQKRGVNYDSYFKEAATGGPAGMEDQKKNMQYVIREYMSKAKKGKKRNFIE